MIIFTTIKMLGVAGATLLRCYCVHCDGAELLLRSHDDLTATDCVVTTTFLLCVLLTE